MHPRWAYVPSSLRVVRKEMGVRRSDGASVQWSGHSFDRHGSNPCFVIDGKAEIIVGALRRRSQTSSIPYSQHHQIQLSLCQVARGELSTS